MYPSTPGNLVNDRRQEVRDLGVRNPERVVADALADAALFSQCSKRELKLVAKLSKTKTVPSGSVLVEQDSPGDSMFVMLSGAAIVQRNGRKIAQLGAGDVVGELALLSRGPRNATVTTTTDTAVALIDRKGLYRLLEDAPGFSRKLLEALANRVRDLDKKLLS